VLQELEEHRQVFEEVAGHANQLTAGLSEAQFNWRPAPAQWSVEECLAHLTMTGQSQVQAIETAINEARARGLTAAGPFEYPAIERYILRETAPPVRHELPAPRRFQPLHGQPITGVLPTFLHVQSQFIQQLERADGLDLRRVKVVTSISRFLKISLGMTFAQAAAHERRHIEQARRVWERLPR
jgi:hypothetical protein